MSFILFTSDWLFLPPFLWSLCKDWWVIKRCSQWLARQWLSTVKSTYGYPFTCTLTFCSFRVFSFFLLSSCAVEALEWNNSAGHASVRCLWLMRSPSTKEGHSLLHKRKVNLGTNASWKMRFWVQTLWQSNINERQAFIPSNSWTSVRRLLIAFLCDPHPPGRSDSGATWPRPCPCCPCASAVSKGCRSAGSATATSWPSPASISRCCPSPSSFAAAPRPSSRWARREVGRGSGVWL